MTITLNPIAINFLPNIGELIGVVNQPKQVKSEKKQSFQKSFFASCIDIGRSCLKAFVQYNPISLLLNMFQKERATSSLIAAKTRNHAKNNEELRKYHKSIEFSDTNPKGIFQFYKSTKSGAKTQVILIMGRGQGFRDKEEDIGMLKIYNRLKKENNCDVLLCRSGSAIADLKHRYGLSSDASLKPEVVKEHVSNLIEDRLKKAGVFSDSEKARNVVIVGYSWGAGLEAEILERWNSISGNTPVTKSISLDAIEYGCENFAAPVEARPKHSKKHINIFQSTDLLLSGSNLSGMKKGDEEYQSEEMSLTPCPDHDDLDNCDPVIDKIYYMIAEDIVLPEEQRELQEAA